MGKNYDDAIKRERQVYNELMQNSPEYRQKAIDRAREIESISRYNKLPMTSEMEEFNRIAGQGIKKGK